MNTNQLKLNGQLHQNNVTSELIEGKLVPTIYWYVSHKSIKVNLYPDGIVVSIMKDNKSGVLYSSSFDYALYNDVFERAGDWIKFVMKD